MTVPAEALAAAAALEASTVGIWMRGSGWAYPVVNLLHLAGLVLLVGNMLLLDLRLLGFGQRFELVELSSLLTRLAVAGLLLSLASGLLLFAADAVPLLVHPLMQVKVALVVVGIANAIAFRWAWRRRLARWDEAPPGAGRLQAMLSLGCWLMVAGLGRWLAYA